MTLLEVGTVVRPHGLKGEVEVRLVTDRLERVAVGSVLHTDGSPLEIVASRPFQDRHLVTFAGVVDRAGADALRGTLLRAAPLDDADALWVHELIGSAVVDLGGTRHGTVVAVEANPASDLLVLDDGRLVPLAFLVEAADGTLTVDPPAGLLDDGAPPPAAPPPASPASTGG